MSDDFLKTFNIPKNNRSCSKDLYALPQLFQMQQFNSEL